MSVMEECIPRVKLTKRCKLHLSSHSVFHQWGFRSGHSTSSALTTIINVLAEEHGTQQTSLLCFL